MDFPFRKYYLFFFQVAISLLALAFVIYKVFQFGDWPFFFEWLMIHRWDFLFLLLVQLILSGLNLSLEALKWQMLTSVLKPQRFYDAFKQIVRGIQFGILTPARTGEPVGKALLFAKGSRTQALLLSAAGSMIQNAVIVVSGTLALLFLRHQALLDATLIAAMQKSILQYGFFIPLVLIFLLLGIYHLLKYIWQNPVIKKLGNHIQIYKKLGFRLILQLFLVTGFRFLVFCFQLWLALHFFEVDGPLFEFWLIPLYFTIITFIPTIALADLGIRSSIALFVFGVASTHTAAIVSSVFILWFVNLALPALAGIILLKDKK